ncbi:hypothetical protein [Corynebacterium epidermidicanis]|nr:hypothetical protein [Corynebacterium epidermidicanis]
MNFNIVELVSIVGSAALLLAGPALVILVIWNVIKGYRSRDDAQRRQ